MATNTYAAYNGPLTKVTYGNGDVRTYGYNWMNALTSVGDGTTTLHSWVYDDNNHLSIYKDLVANRHWRYQYDSIGRLVMFHIFNASGIWLGEAYYSYDQRSNMDYMAGWFGGQYYRQWYEYDAIAAQPETANYAKDNLPVRYSMATDRHLDYDYDSLNRLTTKTLNTTTPIITNYTYHLSARNQATESKYQTTQVSIEIVGNIAYRYTYDANGNITKIEKGERTGTNTAGNFTDYRIYTYNARGDLETETNLTSSTYTRYVYDGYGDISFKVISRYVDGALADMIERPVYTYTNGTWSHMLTDYNGQAITYDAIGNPLSYRGATLTWQNGRQLATYAKGDTSISYTYDADGLRTSKTVNGVKHDYYYLDGKLVYEGIGTDDILYYYDSYGTFAGLQYFPNGSNGVMYYAATNMQGDVIGLYDSTGALVVSYEYDAWGKLLSITDTTSIGIGSINPIRYRGYYYDTETGWYYLQSRYYDPEIGRFINADNMIGVDSDLSTYNLYAYCNNNPISNTDSTGCWALLDDLIAAGVGGVVGMASQFVGDMITSAITNEWYFSSWESYVGAFVGGALGGVASLYVGPVLGGALSAGTSTLVGQTLENITGRANRTTGEILGWTLTDAVVGGMLTAFIPMDVPGITRGGNSMAAVYQRGLNKIKNGTASRMSLNVMRKGVVSGTAGSTFSSGLFGIKSYIYEKWQQYDSTPQNNHPAVPSRPIYWATP